MINLEIFLLGLMIISTLTSLVTEAIKKMRSERDQAFPANTIAGIVACVLAVAISNGYILLTDGVYNIQTIIYIIAETFASWLCAMVGYDKVVQAISQFKTTEKEG